MLCSNCTRQISNCQSRIEEGEQNAANKSIANRTKRRKNLATRKKLFSNAQRHIQLPSNPNPTRSLQLPHLLRRSKRLLLAINANHRHKLQLLKERSPNCNPRTRASRIRPNNRHIPNPQQRQIPSNKQPLHNPRTAESARSCIVTVGAERTSLACRRVVALVCAFTDTGEETTRPPPHKTQRRAKFGDLSITKTTVLHTYKV